MKKMTEKERKIFREKENKRKRLWREKKRLEVLKARQSELQSMLPKADIPAKKKFRLRFHRHPDRKKQRARAERIFSEVVPEAYEPALIEEEKEKPMTTLHCPESLKKDRLADVKSSPDNYIEINMVTKSRVVDGFYISSERKNFHYKKKEYRIDEEAIYLLPTKSGYFVPSAYYKENIQEPKGFRNLNKGITGKALSLLYMEQLYTSLLYTDETRYNLFIVILSIALLIVFAVGLYLTVFYNGGIFPQPAPIIPINPIGGTVS